MNDYTSRASVISPFKFFKAAVVELEHQAWDELERPAHRPLLTPVLRPDGIVGKSLLFID